MSQEETAKLAWNMIADLRTEVREAQKIRTQMIGIKITFVTASFGFIFGSRFPIYELLFVPAFASIFFDYLIVSYGISIKRIGYYCRTYLEPKLRTHVDWPKEHPFWEEAMSAPSMKQHFASAGNLGISFLTVAAASLIVLYRSASWPAGVTILILLALLSFDVYFSRSDKHVPAEPLKGTTSDDGIWTPARDTKDVAK